MKIMWVSDRIKGLEIERDSPAHAFFLDLATKFQHARQEEYLQFNNEVNLKPHRYMPELVHIDYMLTTTRGLLSRGYSKQEVKKIIAKTALD